METRKRSIHPPPSSISEVSVLHRAQILVPSDFPLLKFVLSEDTAMKCFTFTESFPPYPLNVKH